MVIKFEILNGLLDLNFNELVNSYTVKIDNDIKSLDFNILLSDDYYYRVRNNSITNDNKKVYVDIYNVDNIYTYEFNVYKEINSVIGINEYTKSLEVSNTILDTHKIELLSIGIFLCIIITFSIIFRRKKCLK